MKAPNHLLGGLVFTGLCSALSGVNIFATPAAVATTVVGALLPDIDHPKSWMGRLFPPLAYLLNRRYGHRTITHSAVALLGLSFVVSSVEQLATGKSALGLVFFFAYLSHLVLDMVTLQGVPLLYPFSKNPFVMPANPRFRIRTDDTRAETIAFCSFLLLGLALRPLFENGFWTSYNRLFGTMKHLGSEFRKTDDLLEVEFFARRGSQPLHGRGFCVEATNTSAVLLRGEEFFFLDPDRLVIDRVLPQHTGRRFFFDAFPFVGISRDSLLALVADRFIARVELSADRPFLVAHSREVQQQLTQRFQAEWITDLMVAPAPAPPVTRDSFFFEPNPRLPVLRLQRRLLEREVRKLERARLHHQRYLTALKQQLLTTADMPQKERLFLLYQEALKRNLPLPDTARLATLDTEIVQLEYQQFLRNEAKRLAVEAKNRERERAPNRFTGVLTVVRLE